MHTELIFSSIKRLREKMPELPIHHILPELIESLRENPSVVLQAPPGAGKTTGVPLALFDVAFLRGQKIIMLEPRRLAARNSALRMAELLGESVGETVGYRIRMEKKISSKTRIEVVTEGILTRMIQSDPELSGVGMLIFDEFHERNLNSDLGLALALESQSVLREDLKILVMSATLDAEPVARLMGEAPILTSHGKSFPVETRYLPVSSTTPTAREIEAAVASAVLKGISDEEGDMLVFLPGAGEIRRVHQRLLEGSLPDNITVYPLFGALSKADQDRAIKPSPIGQRKVVLTTAIAETSLTIDGVRLVVDSGLMRVHKFSPGSGMGKLETLTVSKAAADQRRGRGGRTAPGVCYRLWHKGQTATLLPFSAPEITQTDLAPLALELALWGAGMGDDLAWLTPPPKGSMEQARGLLAMLGALDDAGHITAHGKAMAKAGLHPRLAHMVLKGKEVNLGAEAAFLASLLSERIPTRETDARQLMENCLFGSDPSARRIQISAKETARRFGIKGKAIQPQEAGLLLSFAFPDRLARQRQRGGSAYLMASGTGAMLPENHPLSAHEFLAIADLDGNRSGARVYLAAPITESEIIQHHGQRIQTTDEVFWNHQKGRVEAKTRTGIGALVLEEKECRDISPEMITRAIIGAIESRGLDALPWDKKAKSLQVRVNFLREHAGMDALPDFSKTSLLDSLESWLAPFLHGIKSMKALRQVDLHAALMAQIPFELQRKIDDLAPTHLPIPSGVRVPLDYGNGEPPVLAARIQQLFGLTETPKVAGGKVPVLCHLLSPASRPMQVTKDLASFWKNTYPEVKKDLKGRYPKHPWPDDPLTALATNRAKPRGR